ncbi:hypothetical protein [Cupriavidus consociatus]|nr:MULTISPECIES: hypothetical protein [unclassified Cupriavidus]MBP0619044.1 hypothetical protein [Cupriavidus sp. LEh25]MDK2655690.1 hypothetical protein [Cupriavidus sp. LEh21]
MKPRCGAALGAWLSALGLAAVCAAALAAWLDPAFALAWVQLMALCR